VSSKPILVVVSNDTKSLPSTNEVAAAMRYTIISSANTTIAVNDPCLFGSGVEQSRKPSDG